MHGAFNRPLVYRIDDGDGRVIVTVRRVMAVQGFGASGRSICPRRWSVR